MADGFLIGRKRTYRLASVSLSLCRTSLGRWLALALATVELNIKPKLCANCRKL